MASNNTATTVFDSVSFEMNGNQLTIGNATGGALTDVTVEIGGSKQ